MPIICKVEILFHILKQYAIQIKFLGQAVVLFGCEMLIIKNVREYRSTEFRVAF
jgi:hypothetical protein